MVSTIARAVLASSLLALATAPASAQEDLAPAERYHVRLEYLYWSPEPAGQFQKGFSDREGTVIDAQADLALEASAANELRGTLRLGRTWKLRGSWSRIDFRGEARATKGFTYGTTTVLAGDSVITSLKGNYGSAELEWDFVARERGHAGLLVGAKIIDVDTLLLDVERQSRVVETERLPIPVLGLAGRAYLLPRLSLAAELSGLTLGDRGHVWEWTLAARVHATKNVAGSLGYRRISLEGRDDRDYLKLDLGKWTIGIEIGI